MPTAGSFSYDSTTTSTTTISLESELRLSKASATADKIEWWVNADKDAVPKVETITIASTLPVADAYYRVAVDGPTANEDAVYLEEFLTAEAGLTADNIASRLAKKLDGHPDISASASTNTIVITSVNPGTNGAFTVTVSCLQKSDGSAISSKISTATTTAASGTGKVRKWAQLEVKVGVNANGKPELTIQNGVWYNGASSPTSSGSFGPIPVSGPLSADDLRAVV